MRIALITYSTRPRGGVVHTLALSEALAERGHQVEVWTLARGEDTAFFREVDPRVQVKVVPFPPIEGEDVGARIERSIAALSEHFDSDAEIVHAQDCISANAMMDAGTVCLRTIHHLDEFTTPRLVLCHERAILEPMARICVSRAVAAEVEAGYGLTPTVIPNGVDAARFAFAAGPDGGPARERWRSRLGNYVLALGGIEPRKGSLDLLEAFALLRRDQPDLQLVFGGGETLFDYRPYRARFEQRAQELRVEPVVLGTLADGDVPPLVAAAGALGFVSTKEGFGLAAMEALAAGVPVVARDLPVVREVFGDSLAYAADVDSIAARLSEAVRGEAVPDPETGRALAARHRWADAAEHHERFYTELLRHPGLPAGQVPSGGVMV